ncbi:MAG: 2-hydroxyacid dehydrogenase [Oscillospiraceae bacterium]
MEEIAFFDAKPYDIESFDKLNKNYKINYYEDKLTPKTARLAAGCAAVCAFVNDTVNRDVIDLLTGMGVKAIVMRCAGYNNVDIRYAERTMAVLRVPAYSPYAVAEHAMALLLMLNRKIHKAYLRTRDFNFSIVNLTGFDLHGKTAGVIGTGKIGQAFIDICLGFGMKVIAYDPYPNEKLAQEKGYRYGDRTAVFSESDIISLHCPLTADTKYIINHESLRLMKNDCIVINTSRGKLIDSDELLKALREKRIGGAGLDVYEEESDIFYEDCSADIITDDTLSLLVSMPNVIITSHQAYLTREALNNIAEVTLSNLDEFFAKGADSKGKYTNSVNSNS